VADANPFFFHLLNAQFILFALFDDSLLVELSSLPLLFDLESVLFFCPSADVCLVSDVAAGNVLPSAVPFLDPAVFLVLLVVRILVVVILLLVLVFLALLCGVNDRLAVFFALVLCHWHLYTVYTFIPHSLFHWR
jgi:hypothetical protein